jgi:parallel beta-helix repeat protein
MDMKNGFLTYFVAKNRRNNIKWRVSSALLAGIALLFALQGFSRADDDDDNHNATPISSCTTISQRGRYFLANDLTGCNSGLSITVSDVKLDLRGHTIQGDALAAPMIIVKEAGGASLFKIEIEGPGTVTGGTAGIEFNNVHSSWVHNVVAVGNLDGIDIICTSDCTNNPTIEATASMDNVFTDNVFSDNVAAANFLFGISVNGANHNSFIHNILTGNSSDGLLFYNAKNNVARQNTVDANGFSGIDVGLLSSGNIIDHNTAFGNATNHSNGAVDMMDQNTNCTQNTWTNNSFNLSSPVCIM